MRYLLLKSFIFIVAISSLLYNLDSLFLDNSRGDVASFGSLYQAPKNSIDILFLGNSHLHKGLDLNIIDSKCKVNSISVVGGGLTIAQVYFNLLEVLEYQSPQLVALETWPIIAPSDANNSLFDEDSILMTNQFGAEHFKRLGQVKYKELELMYPEHKLFHLFNFSRYHDLWTDLPMLSKSLRHRILFDADELFRNSNKTKNILTSENVERYAAKSFKTDKMKITEEEIKYMEMIKDLSKEHNFELLYFTIPVYDRYYEKTKVGFERVNSQLKSYISENPQIKYYDMNELAMGYNYTNIVNEKFVTHNQHLNYKGSIKASNKLANFINEEIKLNKRNHRDRLTPETLMYNLGSLKTDESFLGGVTSVNGRDIRELEKRNELIIYKTEGSITLEGWMFKKDFVMDKTSKHLALKRNDDFIYLTGSEAKYRATPGLVETYGSSVDGSGYWLTINKKLLDKGRYKIYHILKSQNGEVHVKDMWKWIVIQ